MKRLTEHQCVEICTMYFKGRSRIYERGAHSIDSIAKKFEVASDTCRRVIKGQYKIDGKLFRPKKHGISKIKYKPAARKVSKK